MHHNGKDLKQPSLLEADEKVNTETNDKEEVSFSEENNKKSQGDVAPRFRRKDEDRET